MNLERSFYPWQERFNAFMHFVGIAKRVDRQWWPIHILRDVQWTVSKHFTGCCRNEKAAQAVLISWPAGVAGLRTWIHLIICWGLIRWQRRFLLELLIDDANWERLSDGAAQPHALLDRRLLDCGRDLSKLIAHSEIEKTIRHQREHWVIENGWFYVARPGNL